jgi:hypothetical protein
VLLDLGFLFQAEFKFLLNEVGVAGKTEWVIESKDNFDIRFDATTPLSDYARVGLIFKHSFEEEETYYSQFSAWVNEDQVLQSLHENSGRIDLKKKLSIMDLLALTNLDSGTKPEKVMN